MKLISHVCIHVLYEYMYAVEGGCLVSLSIILHLVTLRQSPIEPGVRVGNSKLDPPVSAFAQNWG